MGFAAQPPGPWNGARCGLQPSQKFEQAALDVGKAAEERGAARVRKVGLNDRAKIEARL